MRLVARYQPVNPWESSLCLLAERIVAAYNCHESKRRMYRASAYVAAAYLIRSRRARGRHSAAVLCYQMMLVSSSGTHELCKNAHETNQTMPQQGGGQGGGRSPPHRRAARESNYVELTPTRPNKVVDRHGSLVIAKLTTTPPRPRRAPSASTARRAPSPPSQVSRPPPF